MKCNCNKAGAYIKVVQGNVLRLAIPLTLRTVEVVNGAVEATDTDFVPSSDHPVTVVLTRKGVRLRFDAVMRDGNVAHIEDRGTIPVGTYDITVCCKDDNGSPYRFKQNTVLSVKDATAEAGIVSPIDYELKTWYLNAAIYLTTGTSGIPEEVDPVFAASPAANIRQSDINNWNGKVNPSALARVATSGSYNDLTDKPVIPEGADLSNYYTKTEIDNKGYLTNETDPTVPSWAKQPTKPTYTAQEVGALPANTSIPSKTSDLTNDSGFIDKAMYYGLCESAASAMPKVCTVETFPTTTTDGVTHAAEGTVIAVKFINSDTNTTDAPELNVNGIGAKAIMYNNAIVTSTAKNTTIAGCAKQIAFYRYDPEMDEGNGGWEFLAKSVDSNSTYSQASLGQGYGTQTNSSAATAITASISSFTLSTGGIVTIKFTYDVPANATLNISSKGAKAIYNRGAAIAAGVIKAGDTATFIYSTYYHLISIDRRESDSDTISVSALQVYDSPLDALVDAYIEGDENTIFSLTFRDTYWYGTKVIMNFPDDGNEHIIAFQDDLTNYVPTTRTINGKALSSNITLNASDVGAQSVINDLATIRSGASAGATAYQKPASGIPASDIASGVIPDLSGYATTTAMNTALAGKQNTLTFDDAPTANSNNPVKSGGIKTYVDGKVSITGMTTSQDGTFTIAQSDGNSFTIDLNHTHPQYLKYQLLADEAAYNALSTKDSGTLYLIPES